MRQYDQVKATRRGIVQQRSSLSEGSQGNNQNTVVSSTTADANAKTTPPRRNTRRFWFFRRVPAKDDVLKGHSESSEELELLSAWDRTTVAAGRNVLCLQDVDDDDLSRSSSASSASSLSTVAEMRRQQQEVVLLETQQEQKEKPGRRLRVLFPQRPKQQQVIDLQQYMAKREMTPTQERWNALTMVPSPLYCLYFCLAGCWMNETLVQQAKQDLSTNQYEYSVASTSQLFSLFAWLHAAWNNECLPGDSNNNNNMPALPPLPVMAVAVGIILHAPFSFLYHWKYAHALPAGAARTTHWSRRMDQSMIHVASACMSYATSGSWDFFLANVLFNADCVFRQMQHKVRPRRNKIRIAISMLAYTIPIVKRGDLRTFFVFWIIMGISGWLFVQYPIGGWSHAAFHLVVALEPPLLMMAATELPASQEQLKLAATCAALQ